MRAVRIHPISLPARRRTRPWAALAACAAAGLAHPAFPQGAPDSVVQSPAVVVTGTVPGSPADGVSSVGLEPGREPAPTAWVALNRSLANFHASEGGAGGYGSLFAVRGLSNTPYFGEPAVTVYFADIPLPSSFAYPEGLFGFDSASLFRGPRGTQFGRATDGAVVVFSPPNAARAGGELLAGAGSYDSRQAALGVQTDPQGRSDVALFTEYDARDGYIQNRKLGIRVDDQENGDAFARLRVRPSPGDELTFEVLRTRSRDGAQPLVPLGGPLYEVSRSKEGVTDLDSLGAALKGSFALAGGAALTTVTSYTDWRMNPYQSLVVLPPPLSNDVTQEQKRWNEELRLRSNPRSAVRGELGAWLSKGTTGSSVERAIAGLYPVDASSYAEAERSAAVFGEASYGPEPGWSVTAGLRAESDARDFARLEQVPVQGLAFDSSGRHGALLPRLAADWQPDPDSQLEASVAAGLRPAGYSSFTDNPALIPFASERSTQYSAGWSTTVAGRSIRLAATAFYDSISNLQVERSFSATDYLVATAPRAHSLGAELEARWAPNTEWTLALEAGWTRVRLDAFEAPLTGRNESGNEAPNAPSYNASLEAVYMPLPHWFASGQLTAVGRTYFDELGTATYTQDAYALLGLRAGYEAGPWTLLVFGENLAKAGYYELIVPGVNSGAPGAPRTFGAKATMRF